MIIFFLAYSESLVQIPQNFSTGTTFKKIEITTFICLFNMFNEHSNITTVSFWFRTYPFCSSSL